MNVRIVVLGRVQGVGFRFFVARKAEALGVKGAVWNGSDGVVEIIARADEATLATFEASLRSGPGHVQSVSSVITNDIVVNEKFTIDRDRNA